MKGEAMNGVWTIAEAHEGKLKSVSFELLARGRALADKLGTGLCSVVIGHGLGDGELTELILHGADAVYAIQDPELESFVCERYAAVLERAIRARGPSVVLAAATSSGRTLMPYLAVRLHTGLTADCTELDIEEGTGNLLQTRPAIGGNIMACIKTPDHRPQMATVRPKSARPLARDPNRKGRIEALSAKLPEGCRGAEVLGYRKEEGLFVNIEEADVVVAGGKGMKKADNFALLEELASRLSGVVGASREAVDRGWIGYPRQIGLSGKTVSPKLYIGAGISGSIQHLAGIKTSETIVSINTDPDASLHAIADFAIVGDAFQVIPELIRKLDERSKEGK
jgi:electron transfer flavoprotein alpha subunit